MSSQEKNKISWLIEYPNNIHDIIEVLNKEEDEAISISEQIKHEIKFEMPADPTVIFQLIYASISSQVTQDPTKVHFDISRAIIQKIDPSLLNNSTGAVDMIARNLVEYCTKLKLKIIKAIPPQVLEQINNANKQAQEEQFLPESGRSPLSFKISDLSTIPDLDKIFKIDGMFICDKFLLDTVKSTGKKGNEVAKVYKEKLCKTFSEGKSPLDFWFNTSSPTPEEPFHASQAMKILAGCIFDDKVKSSVKFAEKNVSALTKNTTGTIKKIISPFMEVIENSNQIQVLHQDSIICNVSIPTISQKMSHIVLVGAKKLNTVMGHRVLRHFPQEAFRQRINGINDYRVLRYDRGSTDIAEKLNINGKKAITYINQVVHAMAYLEFSGVYFSGNLIQLSKYKSPITNRQEAFEIVVGTPLLPYQTFNEHESLLIPLLSDPPLVNPNQSHAGQFLLQMEIMEVCSNQSISIAQDDIVKITQQQWEILAFSSGLSPEILKKVQDRWMQDGVDGEKLLVKIDHDCYKLGPKYNKEWLFLKEQGQIRIKNSNRGKMSALKRNNSKKSIQPKG